jgi:hypothetical protein
MTAVGGPTGFEGDGLEAREGALCSADDPCRHGANLFLATHTKREHQTIVGGKIVKRMFPKGPLLALAPWEEASPSSIRGIVPTTRAVLPDSIEESRDICPADFFDNLLSKGGALLGGSLHQG